MYASETLLLGVRTVRIPDAYSGSDHAKLFLLGLRLFYEPIVLIAKRQSDFEAGTLAGLAYHHNLTLMARDNAV